MNIQEVSALVQAVQACCPSQKIDDFTASAWHPALSGVPLTAEDAIMLVGELAKTHRYIAPLDIVAAVEAAGADPMQKAIIPPPDVDPDDPIAWLEAYRANVREVRRQIDAGLWAEPETLSTADYDAAMRRQRELFGAAYAPPKAIEAAPVSGLDRPEEWREMRATMDGHDSEFMRRRAIANTVECTHVGCEAPVERSCHRGGKTLVQSPAHPERMVAAGLEKPLPPPISPDKFKAMIDAGLIS